MVKLCFLLDLGTIFKTHFDLTPYNGVVHPFSILVSF